MFRYNTMLWVFVGMWLLVTAILIPVGLTLISVREPEKTQALGACFLMAGILSAGGFLLFIADRH